MKEYKLVKHMSSDFLELKIIELLKLGWICKGGLAVYQLGTATLYCQAMVK